MSKVVIFELILVFILFFVAIIAGVLGWLDKQISWCKIFVYIGIIVLTLSDLYWNNSNTKNGVGLAVIISAFFEIVSNINFNSKTNIKKFVKIIISKLNYLFIGTTLLFIIPAIVYCLTELFPLSVNRNNDWVGFWGGYLGSLIGGGITLIGIGITINHEKRIRDEEYTKKIMPILSSSFVRLTLDDLKNMQETRGIVQEVFAEKTSNGAPYDSTIFKKYIENENVAERYKFIKYTLINSANSSANKISAKLNGISICPNFPLLPKNEINILFVIFLKGIENSSSASLKLDFEFEDAMGKKRYIQHDELIFSKDANGDIYNSCEVAAMTWPEEISRNDEIPSKKQGSN